MDDYRSSNESKSNNAKYDPLEESQDACDDCIHSLTVVIDLSKDHKVPASKQKTISNEQFSNVVYKRFEEYERKKNDRLCHAKLEVSRS